MFLTCTVSLGMNEMGRVGFFFSPPKHGCYSSSKREADDQVPWKSRKETKMRREHPLTQIIQPVECGQKTQVQMLSLQLKTLGPVLASTIIMCEEEKLTVSIIAPLKAKLLEHCSVSEEHSTLVTESKQTMTQELERQCADVQQVLHEAPVTDTMFKKLPFKRGEERSNCSVSHAWCWKL